MRHDRHHPRAGNGEKLGQQSLGLGLDDDDLRARDERGEGRQPFGARAIERDAFFASVEESESGAAVAFGVGERIPLSIRPALRRLDHDDLRPEICE